LSIVEGSLISGTTNFMLHMGSFVSWALQVKVSVPKDLTNLRKPCRLCLFFSFRGQQIETDYFSTPIPPFAAKFTYQNFVPNACEQTLHLGFSSALTLGFPSTRTYI